MTAHSFHGLRGTCTAALAAMLLAWTADAAQAQGISSIVSTNRSTPDTVTSSPGNATEFRSRTAATDAVLVGNVASFEHRLSWFAGQLNGFSGAPPTFEPELAYQVTFTVEDPLNRGYDLRVAGRFSGYIHTEVGGGVSPTNTSIASVIVPILVTTGFAAFEPEAIELRGLNTPSMDALARADELLQGVVSNSLGEGVMGRWSGTRSFMLSVAAWSPSHMYTSGSEEFPALAYMQFGRSPTLIALGAGHYTGPGNPDMSELGHFLTVQARFIAAPIPEPATALLLAAGIGVVALRRRRTL